jgi:transposase
VDDGQKLFDFVHELAQQTGQAVEAVIAKETEAPAGGRATEARDEPSSPRQPKPGRKRLAPDLLRIQSTYELEESERICSCGTPMPKIGEVASEELARLSVLLVHRHVRAKYACNKCDDGVLTAPGPQRVLPKSMAGPSLLSWLIASKFGDHLPYYRLEGILDREGVPVSRATLCSWIHGCSTLLQPIADQVLAEILASGYVQTDDTSKRIQRSKDGSGPRFGHAWVYTTPDGKCWYDFTETREGIAPRNVLAGFNGFVQADAFSGYDELFRQGRVKEVGCWAHAKRKFDEAKEIDCQRAGKALAAIQALYAIERQAKLQSLSPAQRHALRQERAPPILDPLRTWLEAELPRVIPKSPTETAIGYVLNQWQALTRYLEDGRLEIDNNNAERRLRSVAVGRKNDLFVFTEETGQSATVLMSLVESCKAIGLDPAPYFNDVLQEMRQNPPAAVATLTPWAWKERRDQQELRRASREMLLDKVVAAVAGPR